MQYCNIPIFIPELACPHRCVFCNQNKISGHSAIPRPTDVAHIVETHLATIAPNSRVHIAFFGGSFTGIEKQLQEAYLQAAYPFVEQGRVAGIRLSTRPDYISEPILKTLNRYGVSCIELGAQSFDNEVLQRSGRGHVSTDIEIAAQLIHAYNIELGLQMMLGLPGDTYSKSMNTVQRIIELKAANTRIYPTLVIKDTPLQFLYERGEYIPLDLPTAISWAKDAFLEFEKNNITVLRVGLHPSDDLHVDKSLLAGPYHASFKELVLTDIWKSRFEYDLPPQKGKLEIRVSPHDINYAVGYKAANKNALLQKYGWIRMVPDASVLKNEMHVCYC